MNIDMVLNEYSTFLNDLDRESERLSLIYKDYMKCAARCSSCCLSLTILPIEWYAIKSRCKAINSKINLKREDKEKCLFLIDDLCQIYSLRPVICRTHGLPLLYENDEQGWQLSYCDLNFTSLNEDDMEAIFSPENLMNMTDWNSRLWALNKKFLLTQPGKVFSENTRIPMDKLSDQ